jgi:hypothetical protein
MIVDDDRSLGACDTYPTTQVRRKRRETPSVERSLKLVMIWGTSATPQQKTLRRPKANEAF